MGGGGGERESLGLVPADCGVRQLLQLSYRYRGASCPDLPGSRAREDPEPRGTRAREDPDLPGALTREDPDPRGPGPGRTRTPGTRTREKYERRCESCMVASHVWFMYHV